MRFALSCQAMPIASLNVSHRGERSLDGPETAVSLGRRENPRTLGQQSHGRGGSARSRHGRMERGSILQERMGSHAPAPGIQPTCGRVQTGGERPVVCGAETTPLPTDEGAVPYAEMSRRLHRPVVTLWSDALRLRNRHRTI